MPRTVFGSGRVLSVEGVVYRSGHDVDIVACTAPTVGYTRSREVYYTY